ncbi:alpha/beta fold hydrolase [Actinoplanes missouriensis]
MSGVPIVLVHGFYHGAWAWTDVLHELAALGRSAVAVDMAGHGLRAVPLAGAGRRPFDPVAYSTEPSGIADVGLDAAADLLISDLHRIGRGGPVILVGHSMGGAVLTRVAEQAPALVTHLVYLTAYMPASGTACITYPSQPEGQDNLFMKLLVADPVATGALRIDPRNSDPAEQANIREAFYGDVDERTSAAATALLTCDAPMAMGTDSTTLTERGWGAVPRTYVTCSRDRTIPLALQELFIAQADAAFPANPTSVVALDASHSPFLSMPDRVAEIIAGVA